MNSQVSIQTALCLPASDIEALIQGRIIVAMPRQFIMPGRQFALYPSNILNNVLPPEQYYHSSLLATVQNSLTEFGKNTVLIKAWARCEFSQDLDETVCLETLSQLTIWTIDGLQETLWQRQFIRLAYLRVYLLSQPFEMPANKQDKFVALPQSIKVTEAMPVLSDRLFTQRRRQLEKLEPPLHPELEELQNAIAQIAITNPNAKKLDQDIKVFLGWASNQPAKRLDPDLTWIETIAQVGNSSDGHTFEKLVRRGLFKLGFRGSGLNPDSTGGAGGMDFYCESPYPMVGECKATKTEKVTDKTPAQLLKIGMNHLGKTQYDRSIKLIVAAGELNYYALRTATENQMNVIRPETLQRLVELKANYEGAIDLSKLKRCLQQEPFGLADDKLNSAIDKILGDIKLRSHIVQLVKKYLEQTPYERVSVHTLHGAYVMNNPPVPSLKPEALHEILIELSSPLTGYLGRNKGRDGSDRFYFLRDLQVD